ncbi:solute carrier family 49 member 4 homolog [Homarus americanus]|uniref:solute carrier family 49 member 4 homolog n=1 Tax=Homarus americanus TaxID=6706 RepID=UPI001C44C33C|nr:solute carrier family 49 member 4 homolog [Homarus americanus]XP_042239361.1 solute carrier family 49 member 4 homolog [Homarus americanus]XP_042239362.1 solute carrier family 49 member 4 homolog [Homarus americanus]XP_042239363.1 solute carrier family 49 member 4 homolog [Homarus americanus]XP_042239364.1 solute carrier family 49 member 4 homolog [Homarus americanus]XP_042239365.1 solute carrier family 49 member 4 homolog [Homarus americanus]XP_042239366.1 solute carrier family 49 member 
MDPVEKNPLLGAEDLPQSAISPTVSTSYQNPSLHPVLPDISSDVVDGVIQARGHSQYQYMEDPFLGDKDEDEIKIKIYPSRFWILLVFSVLAWFQCVQWNTWGPLSESVNAAFPGWGSETVAMMANWGTITFVLFVTPMCWLMNTKGLRIGVLCCGILVAGGTVLRVISILTNSTTFFTSMCHICAIMVGIAGTLLMAAPPMIAAVWFPPNERTTATAVSQVLNQLGSAGSYLEPLLVRSPSNSTTSEEIRSDIHRLMYIYAGVAVAILVTILVYFPALPPTPPSITSSIERLNFNSSLKSMLRNWDLLLVTLSYSLCIGIPAAWASVLNFSLHDLGMHQNDAMLVGLLSLTLSGVAGLLSGRLTDMVYGHVKISLIVILIADICCLYWFFLLTWGSITVTKLQICVSVVGGFTFSFAAVPLFFELAVENAYPCSEVIVGGLITASNNLVGLLFLLIFFIPNIGYQWVTYLLLGTTAAAFIPLLLVEEDYSRSKIDRHNLLQTSYQPI